MTKIFAHRGFVTPTAPENSLAALQSAYENKFFGLEFDVWFLDGELVVAHDRPFENKKLAKFVEFLHYKNEISYWIDFKNLNKDNVSAACEVLKRDIKDAEINLEKIYFAPFIEDLSEALPVYEEIRKHFRSAQIMAVCCEIKKNDLVSYHNQLRKNHIKFLSIQHDNIDQNFVDVFRDIECFAWTINDLKRIRELEKLGIRYMTSDIITPKNL